MDIGQLRFLVLQAASTSGGGWYTAFQLRDAVECTFEEFELASDQLRRDNYLEKTTRIYLHGNEEVYHITPEGIEYLQRLYASDEQGE